MLTHGFEAPVLAHFDGDHGHFYAEDASNEWHGESVLAHVEEAARLFILVVAVHGGFLDQLVQLRSRGDHALGDLAFGHALSSPKLGDEDQSLKRFLKARRDLIGQQVRPPAGGA
jgi:hypothetical protein